MKSYLREGFNRSKILSIECDFLLANLQIQNYGGACYAFTAIHRKHCRNRKGMY